MEWNKEGETKFFEILERVKSDELMTTHRTRIIKINRELQIPENMLTPMLPVSSISKGPDYIDVSKAEKKMSAEDIKRVWEN